MPSIKSVSASQSVVSTDKSVMDADGVEVCTVYITANLDFQDDDGNPYPIGGVPASLVTIAIAEGGVTITQPTGNLSADGTTTASFTASVAGTKTIVATINGVAVTSGAVVVAGGTVDPPTPGDPFFTDTFAGTQRNPSGGFTYGSATSNVTIVSFDGFNCMRFRYAANADLADGWAEQRFNMGRDLDEVWIDTYLWFPSNYVNRNQSSGSTNNKMLRLWADDYAALGKVGASTWYSASAANNATIRFDRNQGSGVGPSGSPSPELDITLGAWTRFRWHFRYVDSDGNNGLAELWIGATKVASWTYTGSYEAARPHWNNGYLFGWSATGFAEETDIYIKGGTDGPKWYDADPGWT